MDKEMEKSRKEKPGEQLKCKSIDLAALLMLKISLQGKTADGCSRKQYFTFIK